MLRYFFPIIFGIMLHFNCIILVILLSSYIVLVVNVKKFGFKTVSTLLQNEIIMISAIEKLTDIERFGLKFAMRGGWA